MEYVYKYKYIYIFVSCLKKVWFMVEITIWLMGVLNQHGWINMWLNQYVAVAVAETAMVYGRYNEL